ncbi:triple gene block protein 2 [Rubus virus 1]|uniref:Movement protein TGB2 n=7 Tax=Rubus virus 1 TaxID=2754817 RepID=A0AAE7G3N9_9VIRU|nr:triple gene block protein 2 [Rubus virus 1]QLI58027.1 triple gene block protein 2 [Rubus virus 1]
MSLTAPPDYSKLLLPVSIGIAIGVVFYTLTRSNLPHVGDNIHSLPHGGRYVDGTKRIDYCSPREKFPSSNLFQSGPSNWAAITVIVLIVLIHAVQRFSGRNSVICSCSAGAACSSGIRR